MLFTQYHLCVITLLIITTFRSPTSLLSFESVAISHVHKIIFSNHFSSSVTFAARASTTNVGYEPMCVFCDKCQRYMDKRHLKTCKGKVFKMKESSARSAEGSWASPTWFRTWGACTRRSGVPPITQSFRPRLVNRFKLLLIV